MALARACRRLGLLTLPLLGIPALAAASTVQPLSLADLAGRARVVFLGRCLEVRSEQGLDADLVTRVTFAVGEGFKGSAVDTVAVLLPGGELGGRRQQVAGMPTFAPGEEVVLFLTEADGRGRVWPVGLGQGRFRVWRPAGGPARVSRSLDGTQLHGAAARPVGAALEGVDLDTFLADLRRLVGPSPDRAR